MTRFTEEDLRKKGLVKNANGIYEKSIFKTPLQEKMIKDVLNQPRLPAGKKSITFTWARKSISINQWYSSKHWSIRNKQSKEWHNFFGSFNLNPSQKFDKYFIKMRYNSRLDCTNVIAMIKLAEDALKKKGLIIDDSPKYCKSVAIEFSDTMTKNTYELTFGEL